MLAALCVAPAARADQQTAASGQVSATFSFDRPDEYEYTDLRLSVTRAGQNVLERPVAVGGCEEPYCMPAGVHSGEQAIQVRDLDGDAEPEIIVDVFTGGAHCCSVSAVWRWTGSGYEQSERNWADPGYRLRDTNGDGVPEFVSSDARFAYEFAAFAFSAFPLRVLSFRQGLFVDVTAKRKALVRKDAKKWMREYRKRRNGDSSLGILAAWTADQYVLGRKTNAHRFLAAERRAGRLTSFQGWPSGSGFIAKLKRRLRSWGY